MHIGIFGYIDVIVHKTLTLGVWQIPPETSCMYMLAVCLTFQETVTVSLLLFLSGLYRTAERILS